MEDLGNNVDASASDSGIPDDSAIVGPNGTEPVPQASTLSETADAALDNQSSDSHTYPDATTDGASSQNLDAGYMRMVDGVWIPETPPSAPEQDSVAIPPEAPTSDDVSLLRNSGGYTPAQINAFIDRQRPKWYAANYDDAAIDSYYGVEPFDVKGMLDDFFSVLDATVQSGRASLLEAETGVSEAERALSGYTDTVAGGVADAATALNGSFQRAGSAVADQFVGGPSWHDVLLGNWQQSMTSKVARMTANDHSPEIQLPPGNQLPLLKQTVGDMVKFVGDAPPEIGTAAAILAGAATVSNPLTFSIALALAGGVGLSSPDLLRKYINKSYLAGRAENFTEFLHLAGQGMGAFKKDFVANTAFVATYLAAGGPLKALEKLPGVQEALQSKPVLFVVNRLKNMLQAGAATWATSNLPSSDPQHPTMREYLENALIAAFLPGEAREPSDGVESDGNGSSEAAAPSEPPADGQTGEANNLLPSANAPAETTIDRPAEGERRDSAVAEPTPGVGILPEVDNASGEQLFSDDQSAAPQIIKNMMRLNEVFGISPDEVTAKVESHPELKRQLTTDKADIEELAGLFSKGNAGVGDEVAFGPTRSEYPASEAEAVVLPSSQNNRKPVSGSYENTNGTIRRQARAEGADGSSSAQTETPSTSGSASDKASTNSPSQVPEASPKSPKKRRSFDMHHPWPKYLGGRKKQNLVELPRELHQEYHTRVQKFAPHNEGAKYYADLDLEARQGIFDRLFDTTRKFDLEFGTKLHEGMLKEMEKARFFERSKIRGPK